MTKPYSIRKMGTRRGQPHYGADCKLCGLAGHVLSIGYLTKPAAENVVRAHMLSHHDREVLARRAAT